MLVVHRGGAMETFNSVPRQIAAGARLSILSALRQLRCRSGHAGPGTASVDTMFAVLSLKLICGGR
jgi:hypothetical protein